MSRTTAPLLSFSASGQIAKTQVYASWKGRPYVRRYVIPANPNTADQQEVRSAWKWLNDFYRLLPGAAAASWDAGALSRQITGRNLFLKKNLAEFRGDTDLADLLAVTVANGGVAPTVLTITPGNDQLTFAMLPPTLPTGWTIEAFHGIAMKDGDPTAVNPSVITYVTDATDPYSVVMAGLLSATLYRCWGWFTYIKPDGSIAYSGQSMTTGLTT